MQRGRGGREGKGIERGNKKKGGIQKVKEVEKCDREGKQEEGRRKGGD